jgi:hypothetical protein
MNKQFVRIIKRPALLPAAPPPADQQSMDRLAKRDIVATIGIWILECRETRSKGRDSDLAAFGTKQFGDPARPAVKRTKRQ